MSIRLFRDSLSMCKQLGNKAGSSLRIVSSDVVADFLQVGYGLGESTQRISGCGLSSPLPVASLQAQRLPPAPACQVRC